MVIGKKLVEKMKEKYQDYLRIALIAYDDEIGFYENCGSQKADHARSDVYHFVVDIKTEYCNSEQS